MAWVKQNLWDVVLALVSLASGVITALILAGLLPATGWSAALPSMTTSAALFAVSTVSLRSRARDHRMRAVQQECFILITEALVGIARSAKVDLTSLGASVFIVRRSFWQRITRREGTLQRIARLRFGGVPNKSRVKWTVGKGCVGRAWEKVGEDYECWTVQELDAQRNDKGSRAGRRARENMTDAERAALAGKYCEVRAKAILSSAGEVVGVLSVDRPAIHKRGNAKVLASVTARRMTDTTASLLVKALPGS